MPDGTLIRTHPPIWPRFLGAACVLVVALLAATLWTSLQIPEGQKIAIHWNAKGEVDGWGGKGTLWLLPLMMDGMVGLFILLPFIEPRRGKSLFGSKAYLFTGLAVLSVFACVQVGILVTALGKEFPMLPVTFSAVGLLFGVIGNFLGKVRSNFIMGIRTPWTLSSELSWNKTHRLGGKLFALIGVLFLVIGWMKIPEAALLWILLISLFLLVGATTTYSYVVWKNDPSRDSTTRG